MSVRETAGLVAILMLLCAPAAAQDTPDLPAGHPEAAEPAAAEPAAGEPTAAAAEPTAAPAAEPAAAEPTAAPVAEPASAAEPAANAPPAAVPGTGLPPGHPPSPSQPAAMGTAQRVPQVLQAPSLSSAEASASVPAGTIRVTVVDPAGQPIPDSAVDVGVMASGDRSRHNSRTNAEGVATFSDLPTGSDQAYRVNVPHAGAKYSSTPFQLPPNEGYEVRITRLPVTRETNFVFFHVFRTIIEQRGERMHVIHQTELTNAGEETFVFPAQGQRVELPENSLNFQFQRVMTDQRIEEVNGEDEHAYRLAGSLPPGTVRLAWAYDLEVDGEELDIPIEIPLPFFGLQVIAEALPELDLSVRGMPAARRLDQQGQPCEDSLQTPNCAWVTQTRRGPDDARLDRIVVRVSGIPGPGPARWYGVAGACAFLCLGLWLVATQRQSLNDSAARKRRRARLIDEARELEADFEAGEIGPEFRQKRRAAIVRELAVLLQQDEAVAEGQPKR
ncbi:MAG: carboxypeptidase-like regulatory domain-containing protein [Sandaracinaceae bacterium]